MSIIRSSVINLYDGSGQHQFQSKVSSDRVELQTTLPIILKGTSISLTNASGTAVDDVVGVITSMIAQINQLTTQVQGLLVDSSLRNALMSALTADIPITPVPVIYTLSDHYGTYVIRLTNEDGSELSDEKQTSLVNQYFTFRDLNNTAVIKFTGVHLNGGLYVGSNTISDDPIGTKIIMLPEPTEITGPRPADYTLTVPGSIINITFADNTELSDRDKRELVGRSFTYGTVDNPIRVRFSNTDAAGMYLSKTMTGVAIGTPIFLV